LDWTCSLASEGLGSGYRGGVVFFFPAGIGGLRGDCLGGDCLGTIGRGSAMITRAAQNAAIDCCTYPAFKERILERSTRREMRRATKTGSGARKQLSVDSINTRGYYAQSYYL
jgi:hypothetical protein